MKYAKTLETEKAIDLIKATFSGELCRWLNLHKISSPLMVLDGTGINDDLNGIERPVSFPVKALGDQKAVVVHSLAKWKRLRLKELAIPAGEGILTDMRALRPDEEFSPLHSIYVDQWDWEQHILPLQRSLTHLKITVRKIYEALRRTEKIVHEHYPEIRSVLPDEITFIHAEALLKHYPTLTPKQREHEAAKAFGAVFIIGIGEMLSHGEVHDGRAPDYDDWSSANEDGGFGLNGDIILWHPVLECAFEISSMGIRVDREALSRQLEKRDCNERSRLPFHDMLLRGQLTESIGGGIGQSRLCMFLLRKKHIGEVQVSIWPPTERASLKAEGIELL